MSSRDVLPSRLESFSIRFFLLTGGNPLFDVNSQSNYKLNDLCIAGERSLMEVLIKHNNPLMSIIILVNFGSSPLSAFCQKMVSEFRPPDFKVAL